MKPLFVPITFGILAMAAVLVLGGCASTDPAAADSNTAPADSNGQAVSTIPWNKPSSWESGGALGSMMNQ